MSKRHPWSRRRLVIDLRSKRVSFVTTMVPHFKGGWLRVNRQHPFTQYTLPLLMITIPRRQTTNRNR